MRNLQQLTNFLKGRGDDIRQLNIDIAGIAPSKPAAKSTQAFLSKPDLASSIQDLAREKSIGKQQGAVNLPIDLTLTRPVYANGKVSNAQELASNAVNLDTGNYGMKLNPDMDEVLASHELGHIINRQKGFGKIVRDLRNNPELSKALAAAGLAGGIGYSMGNEGNDDIDEAVALAVLSQAPTLIDEAGASLTGLDLMNRAGTRASLGQRGRLAGAYMTYLAPAIVAGLGAAGAGNLLD